MIKIQVFSYIETDTYPVKHTICKTFLNNINCVILLNYFKRLSISNVLEVESLRCKCQTPMLNKILLGNYIDPFYSGYL